MIPRTALWTALLPLTLALGCGSDKKSDDGSGGTNPNEGDVGTGFVTKGSGGSVTLDFSKYDANTEFIVMPYVLGDMTSIDGSVDPHQFEFDVDTGASLTGPGGKLMDDLLARRAARQRAVDPRGAALERDHDKRTLANRFDPAKGLDQGQAFWSIARSLDAKSPDREAFLADPTTPGLDAGVEAFYRRAAIKAAAAPRRATHGALLDGGGTCPSGKVVVPGLPLSDQNTEQDTIQSVFDGTTYCLVVVSTPVTEPSLDNIKASLTKIHDTYANTIYKDQFAAVGNFTFKPVYVVVDVGDSDNWNPDASLNLAGAFFKQMADVANMPMIYIAADFKKVKTFQDEPDATVLTRQFHSVLAHETQHAIMDYYRNRVNAANGGTANTETIPVDEGLAHFMEDLFGFGDDAFAFWAKPFLNAFPSGVTPFLVGGNDYGGAVNGIQGIDPQQARSSAHTLMYYLSSQKGGVEFDNGAVSGGGGIDFVTAVVKAKSGSGPANLAAVYGGDFTEVIGQYLGALSLDNATLPNNATPSKEYTVQAPAAVLTDLTGGTGKNYGMHFNNYNGVTAHQDAEYANANTDKKLGDASDQQNGAVSFWQTKPALYTNTTPANGLKITLNVGDTPNLAVSVVRIK